MEIKLNEAFLTHLQQLHQDSFPVEPVMICLHQAAQPHQVTIKTKIKYIKFSNNHFNNLTRLSK